MSTNGTAFDNPIMRRIRDLNRKSLSCHIAMTVNMLLYRSGKDEAWLAEASGLSLKHLQTLLNGRGWRAEQIADVCLVLGIAPHLALRPVEGSHVPLAPVVTKDTDEDDDDDSKSA